MLKKKIMFVLGLLASLLIGATPAFAHAVVKPDAVGIGAFTDFTLGVPSEKDVATVGIRLLIPAGINSVTPTVKTVWKVEVINSAQKGQPDDDGNVAPIPEAIVWTGGSVPAHQKEYFMFSTQVPAKETELDWKVEQTYADGSVVLWDQNPSAAEVKTPFSKTMVVNDLKPVSVAVTTDSCRLPMVLSLVALALSVVALSIARRKA